MPNVLIFWHELSYWYLFMMKNQKEFEWSFLEVDAALNRPRFWHYVVFSSTTLYADADESLRELIEKTIQSLVSHEFTAGKHIEKMHGTTAKTIRMNHADRLIFSVVDCHGVKVAFVQNYILKHKLQVHRHLLEKSTIERNEAVFLAKCNRYFQDKTAILKDTPVMDIESYPDLRKMIPSQQMVSLTPQQTFASSLRLPLMQSGPGGSGKTLTALARIAEAENFSILFITNAHLLVNQVRELLQEWQIGHHVEALHYTDWIARFAAGRRLVGDEHFFNWYKIYVSHQHQISKSAKKKSTPPLHFDGNEKLMNTMKYFSGRRKEEFAARHFLFPEEQHEALFGIFLEYMAYLEKDNALHPDFYKIPDEHGEKKYQLVVVDESQTLTLQQIDNIFCKTLKTEEGLPAVVVNYDSHQSVTSHCSTRENILQRMTFDKSKFAQHHVELQVIHRSPKSIVELVNRFIACVKYPLVRGRADVYELPEFEKSEEQASAELEADSGWQWVRGLLENPALHIRSPGWLVITHEEFHQEAITHFGNACSFQEAIGLEHSHVCLYRPFDLPIFRAVDKSLKDSPTELRPTNEAKKSVDLSNLPLFNQMISAMLRTTQSLVLIQGTKSLGNIYQRLSVSQEKELCSSTPVISRDTLLNQLKQFFLSGQFAYVERAFRQEETSRILGMSYSDFVESFSPSKKVANPHEKMPSSEKKLRIPETKALSSPESSLKKQTTSAQKNKSATSLSTFSFISQKETSYSEYAKKLYHAIPEQFFIEDSKIKSNLITNLDSLFKHSKWVTFLCQLVVLPSGPLPLLMALLQSPLKVRWFTYYFEQRPDNLRLLSEKFITEDQDGLDHIIVNVGDVTLLRLLRMQGLIQKNKYNIFDQSALTQAFDSGFLPYIEAYEACFSLDDLDLFKPHQTLVPLSKLTFDYTDPEVMISYYQHKNVSTSWSSFVWKDESQFIQSIMSNHQHTCASFLKENFDLVNLKVGPEQFQPIHLAVQSRNPMMVELLIHNGADVNAKTKSGVTPLMMAFRMNDVLTTARLIFHGADFNFESHVEGLSALQIGCELKRGNIFKKCIQMGVISPKIMDFIVSQGEDFSEVHDYYETALMISTFIKKKSSLNWLESIFEDGRLNTSDFWFLHCHLIALESPVTLLDLLIHDADYRNMFGHLARRLPYRILSFAMSTIQSEFRTVFHYAIEQDGVDFLKILIKLYPLAFSVKDVVGETVFQLAIRLQRKKILGTFFANFEEHSRVKTTDEVFEDCRVCITYDDFLTFSQLLERESARLFPAELSDAQLIKAQRLVNYSLRLRKIDFLEALTIKMQTCGYQPNLVQLNDYPELFQGECLDAGALTLLGAADASFQKLSL